MKPEIDEIKLEYLAQELKNKGIIVPDRRNIGEILRIGYAQSGKYLKKLKEKQK